MKSRFRLLLVIGLSALSIFAKTLEAADQKRMLLFSGGYSVSNEAREYFSQKVDSFLGTVDEILVIPYAMHPSKYAAVINFIDHYKFLGNRRAVSIVSFPNPVVAVQQAKAIFVFGGNTYRLLKNLQNKNLLSAIKARVTEGVPYVGTSAGTIVACPTMMTTNDMPIFQLPNLTTLGLVPFQINAHYVFGSFYSHEGDQYQRHAGESRETRLMEYHEENNSPVMGIPENTMLEVIDGKVDFISRNPTRGRLYVKGRPPRDVTSPADLTAELMGGH